MYITIRGYIYGVLFFMILFFSGCASQTLEYYWDDYSNSMFAYRLDPSEENIERHRYVLEIIIEESEKKHMRVPPGVYAELGFIRLQDDEIESAVNYFQLEKQTYPESTVLMQRLIQIAQAAQKTSDKSSTPEERKNSEE